MPACCSPERGGCRREVLRSGERPGFEHSDVMQIARKSFDRLWSGMAILLLAAGATMNGSTAVLDGGNAESVGVIRLVR